MYNFKKRVGLAIGTADPNDEDIQNTATGLGGLILRSDLYNKAVAEGTINPNTTLQDFNSFVVTDPDLVDPGIDVSGLRTTTDVSPYLLGGIPDYEGIQYEVYNPNRLTDLMRLYSSGLPTNATDTAQPATPPSGEGGGGSGDGGQATTIQPIDTPIDTGGEITNVDTPLTQMITDPATGQTQTVRQAMTSDDAYRGVDEVEPYRDPIMDMVEQPQADSILAGEAMSRANTGLEDDFLDLIGAEQETPQVVDVAAAEAAIARAREAEQALLDSQPQPFTGEPQAVNTILGPDGITYDAVTGLPVSDDPIMDSDLMAIRQQQNALPQEQQDPGFWETARDNFIQTGQDVGNFFRDLGGQGIDIAQLAGTTLLNLAGKALTGVPLLGTALSLLGGAESASGAQQGLVSDQFEEEGVTLDDIGRIQQVGLDYDTPENVMAGYSPGETGIRIGDISVGGGTIQESIVDRLADLEKTKNEKYDGSFYDANGNPKLNPDTGEPTTLGAREEALKENLNIVARAAGADTIEDGTTLGPGEAGFLDDTSDLVTKEEQDAINLQETVDAGIQSADDDSGSEMLDTTPTNITTNITSDQIDEFDTTPVTDPDTTTFVDDFEVSGDAAPITGDSGADSFFDAVDNAAAQAAAAQPISNVQAAANQDSYRGGGGGDRDPAPSAPAPAAPVYQDAIMRGQTGGGNDRSGGGKIVCTMMNNSYGFGSFRNKIWLRHSKNLALEYQKGYHKIFLPLVKIAKTNKVVRKILEHIAVHRTIDIRQESRGKVHLLGRLYRKILEPICYVVGKYAK